MHLFIVDLSKCYILIAKHYIPIDKESLKGLNV